MIQKKKILFVIPALYSAGAEHQTVDIVNKLQNDYNVFLLVLSEPLNILKRVNLKKESIFLFNSSFNTLSFRNTNIKEIYYIVKEINVIISNNNIDVVYGNLPISHFILRLVKLFRKKNFKLCNIHHSLQYSANPLNSYKYKIFNSINNILSYLNDDINIFISNASKKDMMKYFYFKKQTKVIYNGIEIPSCNLNNPFPKKYLNHFKIVVAGRMVPEKGHLFFLATLKKLLENGFSDKMQVFFIGDGYKRKEIELFIRDNNLNKYITIVGNVQREKLIAYFARTDLVVIPSVLEGFGNIAVEAILAGATVLSSNTGGLDEIIVDGINGFKYNYKSSDELMSKIIEIQNGLKKIQSDKAIKITFERFSMNRMIEEYKNVTREIIK
jgi:glycosyltransferase involved in cell wall biosynthesis